MKSKIFFDYLKQSPRFTCGLACILFILILTLGAPLFSPYGPYERFEGAYHEAPSWNHFLGTTRIGRDVFSQTLYGGRTSILLGLSAALLSSCIAIIIGITAGYFGGVIDHVITSCINVFMVIPQIVLLLIIASMADGVSPKVIGLIIGLTSWPYQSRILRAQTLSIRKREFVLSAESLGEGKIRCLFFEIMPNMLSIISSLFVGTVIYAIMAQTFLEFIGFGDAKTVTWGQMLYTAQNTSALNSGIWWEVFGPSFAIVFFGAGLTLLNFSIDEISNPKLKASRNLKQYYKAQLALTK